jgi:hypothetical protein
LIKIELSIDGVRKELIIRASFEEAKRKFSGLLIDEAAFKKRTLGVP